MPVDAIDHVNIRTPDVPGTARFFADALDMAITPSPGDPDPARAAWIRDADGRAVVHLIVPDIPYPWEDGAPAAAPEGSGRLHHVALRCSDYPATVARLTAKGLRFHAADVPAIDLRQLFVTEPNGILLELNFFAG